MRGMRSRDIVGFATPKQQNSAGSYAQGWRKCLCQATSCTPGTSGCVHLLEPRNGTGYSSHNRSHELVKQMIIHGQTRLSWGAWVALSVKCQIPDCGSGHDLSVQGSSPVLAPALSGASA